MLFADSALCVLILYTCAVCSVSNGSAVSDAPVMASLSDTSGVRPTTAEPIQFGISNFLPSAAVSMEDISLITPALTPVLPQTPLGGSDRDVSSHNETDRVRNLFPHSGALRCC